MNKIYWSVAMFKNYFKIAFRNILRNKLSAGINLFGLAVGMACFILIALWVQDEMSFDDFHKNKENLYLLTIEHPNNILDYNVPYALPYILAKQYPEIQAQTVIYELGEIATCTVTYQPEQKQPVVHYEHSINLVSSEFFHMFSYPFVLGSPETALQELNSVVVSEQIAAKYFGPENPLGENLTLNNQEELIVTGVIKVPANSHLQPEFIALLQPDLSSDWNWRDRAYVLLDERTNLSDFRTKIAASLDENYPNNLGAPMKVDVLPIEEVHLGFGRKIHVYIFSVIALFILFIACVNYMNLATAGAGNRAREVGLRKTIGARKNQLVYQFLGESVLMSILAFLIALGLTQLLLPLMNRLTAKQLSLFPLHEPILYLFLIGLILFVGLISGSYPALFLTSARPIETLRATLRFQSGRSLFRIVTVVGQFTISILLIISTAVVYRQLHFIQNQPLGIQTDYTLKIPVNDSLRRRYVSFRNELLRNPNISHVSRGQAVPYAEDYKTNGVEWDGKDPDFSPTIRYSLTDFDFVEMFGLEIKEGRSFSRDFQGDRSNFLINEAAAEYMGMENPVGQQISFWGRTGQIIGVVKDYHHVSLHREILPHIFTINPRFLGRAVKFIFVRITATNIPDTLAHMQEASKKIAPAFPLEYTFLDEGVGAQYESEQRLGKIFTYFAFLAILISCLGIFGLSAFSAEQRTKEIGVRKILGASVTGITVLLSKQFSRWVLFANLFAWPIAYYAMYKWLENFAYRIGINLLVFAGAGMLALLVASLPVGYQALKAASSNPVEALRYE
jgi:ABC-type antimicrobial peptide transport system permease subunit